MQRLGLLVLTAKDLGSIPGWRTEISKISQAVSVAKKKKKREKSSSLSQFTQIMGAWIGVIWNSNLVCLIPELNSWKMLEDEHLWLLTVRQALCWHFIHIISFNSTDALWRTYNTVSYIVQMGFLGITVVKNLPADAEDPRHAALISGFGRFPGVGNGNLLQHSCLENSMDRGAWWAKAPWSREEADMTEHTHTHTHTHTLYGW